MNHCKIKIRFCFHPLLVKANLFLFIFATTLRSWQINHNTKGFSPKESQVSKFLASSRKKQSHSSRKVFLLPCSSIIPHRYWSYKQKPQAYLSRRIASNSNKPENKKLNGYSPFSPYHPNLLQCIWSLRGLDSVPVFFLNKTNRRSFWIRLSLHKILFRQLLHRTQ